MKKMKLRMPMRRRAPMHPAPAPAAMSSMTPSYGSSPAMPGMMGAAGGSAMPPKLSSLRNIGRMLKRRM